MQSNNDYTERFNDIRWSQKLGMAYSKSLTLRRIIKSFSIVIILIDLLVPPFETQNQIEHTFTPWNIPHLSEFSWSRL